MIPGLSLTKRRCFRRSGTLNPPPIKALLVCLGSRIELLVSPDVASPLKEWQRREKERGWNECMNE